MLPPFATPQQWVNKHGTITQTRQIATPDNFDANGNRPDVGAWRLGLEACVSLVKAAETVGHTLVPIGSAWSLSDTLRTRPDGWLVETSFLNEIPVIGMDLAHLQPEFAAVASNLVFAQAGNTVARMHAALAGNALKLALSTSGASCGQTLAGAFSTGTHGAALRFGATQEMVLGVLTIITGGEVVWIEQASRPVVTDAWCTAIGARLVRDDDIFAAAIVSFGTMGLVHGYLIQAEPMYLLRGGEFRAASLAALYAGITRNGDVAEIDLPAEVLPGGSDGLAHLSVTIDPNPAGDACVISAFYSDGPAPDYTPNFAPAANPEVGDDALLDIAALMNGIGVLNFLTDPLVKTQAAALLVKQAPLGNPSRSAALGEFFPRIHFPMGGISTEIGVDVNDLGKAVPTIIAAIRARPHAYPGIVSLRFVRGSSQILAFTRFPVTCTIELPIANTDQSLPLFQGVWQALETAGVTYTLHWGQGSQLTPEKVIQMYGEDAVTRWKNARASLLGPSSKNTFRNVLSDAAGLTET